MGRAVLPRRKQSGQVLQTVDILDLRHFSSADLRPLLLKEAELWSERMNWDYRSSAEMILRYLDSKVLPGYSAILGDRLAAYAFFIYEGSKGVIGDLFSDVPEPDTHRVQDRLLTHVIETLQHSPGVHRIEAQLLLHDSGTMLERFVKEGFGSFPRLFMRLDLTQQQTASKSKLPKISLQRWSESDFQPAGNLITLAYRDHVDAEINDQYRSVQGSLRFLNNIVRFPGCGVFDPATSFVVNEHKKMIGLLLCSQVNQHVGHVTQVCVLPEYRGRGMGEALMVACIRELRRKGGKELTLTVTEANHSAVELYYKLGFTRERVFDAFVWEQ